ncbi:hypothetical protein CSOJ01_08123 [Colletotrichum sojae]|uniref:Uncharacterized protein n=1 Tax=Colletotrichum sojae TaxID=2175907 RepID=A0A8H6J6Q4_9PEZI|nr:hypothetical protein CSOJ01_08123 [Colletotrichum sojae]
MQQGAAHESQPRSPTNDSSFRSMRPDSAIGNPTPKGLGGTLHDSLAVSKSEYGRPNKFCCFDAPSFRPGLLLLNPELGPALRSRPDAGPSFNTALTATAPCCVRFEPKDLQQPVLLSCLPGPVLYYLG